MIKINRVETTYPAPVYGEDYCPDGESTVTAEEVSFRELVDLIRAHPHPSTSHLRGSPREWFTAESEQDYQTGEYIEQSLHYADDNHPRYVKYWRAAIRAAGYRA